MELLYKAPRLATRVTARNPGRGFPIVSTVLFTALLLVVAITFDRYGFTIDEEVGFQRAARIYEFLASAGRNIEGVSHFEKHSIYGAMPDVIAFVLQKWVPPLSFQSRHLVSALFGVAGVYYLFRLAALFIGPKTGLAAAVLLACNPMWFGYMFFDLKDIPFATTLLASSCYGLLGLTGRSSSWSIWLKFGTAVGFLATTKLIGPLLLGFVLLVMLTLLLLTSGVECFDVRRAFWIRLIVGTFSGIIGCLVCFLLFWPQFFFFNVSELGAVITTFLHFENWHGKVLLNGLFYPADQVPRYYTLVYMIISMPLPHLLLAIVGLLCGLLRRQPIVIGAAVICLSALAEQALTGARAFDGYRHFLFLIPFIALMGAYPLGRSIESRDSRFLQVAAITTLLFTSVATIVQMYRLFPYEYSYYNVIVGGLKGADGKYYIDVWRSAFREAFDTVEKLAGGQSEIHVLSCAPIITWEHPKIRLVTELRDADYLVLVRQSCVLDVAKEWRMVAEVRRLGVLFARVYALEPTDR